jgi:hypothetical protein
MNLLLDVVRTIGSVWTGEYRNKMQIFFTENKIKALSHKRMKNLICQHQIFAPKNSNILIESSFWSVFIIYSILFLFVGMEWNTTKPMIVMQFRRHLHFGKYQNKKYDFNKFEISRNMNMNISNWWQEKVQNFYTEEKIPLYSWHSHFLVKQLDLLEFKIVFFFMQNSFHWFSLYSFLLFGIDLYVK